MKKKIVVEGMKCENCAKHVKEAVTSVEGVISADVNLSNKSVIAQMSSEVSDEAIKLAVNTEKYKIVEIETI